MLRAVCDVSVRLLSSRLIVRTLNKTSSGLNEPAVRCLCNYAALNAVNKTLTKPARDDLNTLFSKIESQRTTNGYLNYDILTQLLNTLESSPDQSKHMRLSSDQINFLLETSGTLLPALNSKERIKMFERLWRIMQDQDLLNEAHYHVYLRVHHYNRITMLNVEEFLKETTAKFGNAFKSSELLSLLLAVTCAAGNMRQAAVVLSEIRSNNFPLTEQNFASLLLGNALNGDYKGIASVQDSMIAAGLTVTNETQMMLVCGYLEHGDTSKAFEILSRYHRQYRGEQVIQMLGAAVRSSNPIKTDEVTQLINELPADFASGMKLNTSLQNICIELLYKNDVSTVKTILMTLPTPSYNENQDVDNFGAVLLQEMFRAQINVNEIIEMAQMLIDSGKNTRALHVIAEVALRRNTPLALSIFKALAFKQDELRPHYFWPLFTYNFRRHGESGIIRTLKIMSDFNVECDEDTLRQYVLPRLSVILNDPEQSMKLLNNAGVSSSKIMVPIIKHLISQNKIVEAVKLVALYPTKLNLIELISPMTNLAVNVRSTKQYHQYAKLFKSLSAKTNSSKLDFVGQVLVDAITTQDRLRKDPKAINRIIQELHKVDLSISYGAAECIINMLKEEKGDTNLLEQIIQLVQKIRNDQLTFSTTTNDAGSVEFSSYTKHPRDMSIDELECHLVELEAKQLNARGVLRRLLQVCVRDGRLKRALEIKSKCDELKVLVSPGMLASVLDMYIKMKDLHKAKDTLKTLQADFPGFQIDEHKLIDFCSLLVENKELESAKQILQTHANTQRVQGGDYVLKNIWNLLNSVALFATQLSQTELPEEKSMTTEVLTQLQSLGYCTHQNAILGPIVRERLLRGQIEFAVNDFIQLAEKYKSTPLQFELLSLLVSYCNDNSEKNKYADNISAEYAQQLLSQVCDTIKKIHGVQNLNSALLLAFAESGTDGQLRRLFINPEFRINQDLLMKNCENLDQKGAVNTLLRLAYNARGVGHILDEQRIYDMILQHCIQRNDFNAALDLYERLNVDDELKISKDFLRQLTKLLVINKIEVPNSITLRAI